MAKQHKPKKDRYSNARGGGSQFLDLFCSNCGMHLVLYQKDGPGQLLRLYLDRLVEPEELSSLQSAVFAKSDMPNLRCHKCDALVGVPMVYRPEDRLAYRLIQGSFRKKKSDGSYPPK